ncbi:MAG TPA: integrin alpha [Candidatus Eisenbacteria bacterium]|nr:integrin alpha [Candidatus Eisenbacteria bacterium]
MPIRRVLPAALLLAVAAVPAQALDLATLRALDGAVANGEYGFATCVVGDMDGDGFAEYAVGAPADSTGGPGAGRVFIFRGGPAHAGDPPAWILTGLPGDLLGDALAPAGDVDGDGYADLIVGAPAGTSVAPALPGRVLIVFGSAVLGTRAPLAISGGWPGGQFGAAVAGLGRFDGDAYDDIAVGAPGANNGNGAVCVFRGGAPPATAPAWTLHGRGAGDAFGSAVAGAGHLAGGAFGSLLVGAPFNSDAALWAGKVWWFAGGAPPDTLPDAVWSGAAAGDFFGSAVAGPGDVDGDGLDDALVGAPGANVGAGIDDGRAYVFLGHAPPPAAAALAVDGTRDYGELGTSVAGVGDLDGDGLADWAVGAPGSPDARTAGEVRVFLGRPTPVATPDTVLAGEVTDDMFGRSVSAGGRVDAGTRAFFLVGAYNHGAGGRAYLEGSVAATLAAPPPAPPTLALAVPAPNPAGGRVRIVLTLAGAAAADPGAAVDVLDAAGRRVSRLSAGALGAGAHAFAWPAPGADPAPGLYWIRARAGGEERLARFVWLGR